MTDRFNDLEASLVATQASLVTLGTQIKEVENASSDYDCHLLQVEQTCTKLRSEYKALCLKVINLEARSRRQNIRVIGLPENVENGRPTELMTKFISELLGADNFSQPPSTPFGEPAPTTAMAKRSTFLLIIQCR